MLYDTSVGGNYKKSGIQRFLLARDTISSHLKKSYMTWGAKALAPAISESSSLAAADLSRNELGDEAEQMLRESVKDRAGFNLEL